ncbi:MAG: TldD/PmbA family protein, partial [Tannerellaceae bacterium]|nr:TldD/PmbA family protein [Tannerellaceae bacterium]
MITNDNKKLAQWAMDFALKNGCQASRVSLYKGTNSSFEVRDMKIDRLTQASESALVIHLFVDGRYGSFSTNRLEKKELEKFIQNGIDSTRYLAVDEARTLPDTSLYYQGGGKDLELSDSRFDTINPDEKKDLAMKVCGEIMGKDPRIISASSSYADEKSANYMIASNGFEGEQATTAYSLVGSVSIKGEGEARPESYWFDSAVFFNKMIKEGIGNKALERTIQKIGQKKVASGKYAMIVDNMNSSHLLSPIIRALYGSAIQQKNSFLLNKLNSKVLGDNVTIIDEPHMTGKQGARYFDGEGVRTRRMPVFENGILKTYYFDTYSANKLAQATTISGPSILTIKEGNKDVNGLIANVNKGILVTGF